MGDRYDDAYKWSKETAHALRAGDLAAVDMNELIEEVESVASSLRRELESNIREILEALLTLSYTEGDRQQANRQLVHAQGQLQLILSSAPSIREIVAYAVVEEYPIARGFVLEDFGVSLPDRCPFPLEEIMENPKDRLLPQGRLA